MKLAFVFAQLAMRDGANIKSMHWWSLVDNGEWDEGPSPAGTVGAKPAEENYERYTRPSYGEFQEIALTRQVKLPRILPVYVPLSTINELNRLTGNRFRFVREDMLTP